MSSRRWSISLAVFSLALVLPMGRAESAPRVPNQSPSLTTLPRPDGNLEGFGYAVAISGDTAVVVSIETHTPSAQGEAFIYSIGPRGWSTTPVATLGAPSGDGQFGTVVSLSGDTLAISDPLTTPESVYLYTKGADGWPTTPTVTETDPQGYAGDPLNDAFGQALAVSGNTLMIGAANIGDNGDGVVYEYTDGPGGWPTTPTATLVDPGGSPTNSTNDGFGQGVAVSGTTAMIGAYGTGGDGRPLVYQYTETDGGWPTTPTRTLTAPQSNECFGESGLSISGTAALIGGGCFHRAKGVVYAYRETGSGWGPTPVATIDDPAPGRSNYFGTVEAFSDGLGVVGSPGFHHREGRAYVYAMDDNGNWNTTPIMVLQDPSNTEQDDFGWAVGLSGSTVIIGADGSDENGHGSQDDYGLAYLADV